MRSQNEPFRTENFNLSVVLCCKMMPFHFHLFGYAVWSEVLQSFASFGQKVIRIHFPSPMGTYDIWPRRLGLPFCKLARLSGIPCFSSPKPVDTASVNHPISTQIPWCDMFYVCLSTQIPWRNIACNIFLSQPKSHDVTCSIYIYIDTYIFQHLLQRIRTGERWRQDRWC
jgi:hypothetical protein